MNVYLLGATGKTGKEILKRLISEKHSIKVLVRDRSKFSISDLNPKLGQVEIIEGQVAELDKLTISFAGSDIILSVLGTGKNNNYTDVYSQGGRNILSAMRTNQIKKLITVTSGLIDMSDPGTDNFFLNRVIRPNYNKVYYDQTRWETILDDTADIDWICVRPTTLTDKKPTRNYRVNIGHCPKGGWKISRTDLADFIITLLPFTKYTHQKPTIAY